MTTSDTGPGPIVTARVRVRYAETDRMGVAYYANYLVWFEVGRTEWLRARGWTYRQMEIEDGIALPVIEVTCVYHESARYDDELAVRTRAEIISGVRLTFHYAIVRAADEAPIATGRTMHAAVDRQGRPCRLPARVRALLT